MPIMVRPPKRARQSRQHPKLAAVALVAAPWKQFQQLLLVAWPLHPHLACLAQQCVELVMHAKQHRRLQPLGKVMRHPELFSLLILPASHSLHPICSAARTRPRQRILGKSLKQCHRRHQGEHLFQLEFIAASDASQRRCIDSAACMSAPSCLLLSRSIFSLTGFVQPHLLTGMT